MMKPLFLMVPLVIAGCVAEKSTADKPYFWKLVSIDGEAFTANATLAVDGDQAFGRGPCNAWNGVVVSEPFPEWNIRQVASTRMACDDLAAETQFFAAMADMTHQSVGIGHLELVDQKGREMKFVPANAPAP